MQASSEGENRATEISEISRSLKSLARSSRFRGGALTALSRGRAAHRPEAPDHVGPARVRRDRAGRRPHLAIYREEVYTPDTPEKGVAEIIILKQRNGPIGTIKLTFLGNTPASRITRSPARSSLSVSRGAPERVPAIHPNSRDDLKVRAQRTDHGRFTLGEIGGPATL